MFGKLTVVAVVLGLLANTLIVSPAQAGEKSAVSSSKGKSAAKCMLSPMTCSHCKAAMKSVNGTTMKCTKCGMTAAAMCSGCKVKLSNGKCTKCGMTMAQLKGEPAKSAAKCMLSPMTCSHCKAPMKSINGTTMKCTKCGMTAAAMCAMCKVKLSNGKCTKCGMTMAQLKDAASKPAAKPAMKKM